MRQKAATEKKDSLRLFYIFSFIVIFLIIGSLLIKSFQTIKESKYDSGSSFILTVNTKNGAVIYSINPQSKELSALRVLKNNNLKIGSDLGIPVNAKVDFKTKLNDEIRLKSIYNSLFFKKSELTWFDVVRLILTTSRMNENPKNDIYLDYNELKLNKNNFDGLFFDPKVVKEKATISIINATGIGGRGGKLEEVLTNLGGNIISVTTSQKTIKTSEIQFIDPSLYTVKKIQSILKIPIKELNDLSNADINIIIGEDLNNSTIF